jgi:hypothetical protein
VFSKLKKAIADDNELDSGTLRFLSLVFLLICGTMSFLKYTHDGWLWDTSLTFKPGFISSIFALLLISPLYLRGVLKWNKSIFSLVSLILILLVFASFTELAIGGNTNNKIVISLLVAAVLLSWLGIKGVAGVSWMLALAAAIYSAIVNNMAMGFFGFIYVACGFIGLVLHSGLNPGELIDDIRAEYGKTARKTADTAKSDMKESLNKIT